MRSVFFSIIIPSYCSEKTIRASIDSIIDQSSKNYEILVIDGLSSDKTLEIVGSYGSTIQKVVSEKDRGVYDAINKGIKLASGEYIYILGSDDKLFESNILENIQSMVGADRPQLIYGNVENVGRQHRAVPAIHQSSFDTYLFLKNTLHQQGCFYHHSLFSEKKFNAEYKILGDYDFHLQLFQEKISSLQIHTTVATCEAQGLSKRFTKELYQEELKIKKQRLNFFWLAINRILIPLKYFRKRYLNF
jgi:glycosyltransferase involved in cell wall biosynthesis